MSEFRDTLKSVVNDRMTWTAEQCKDLASGYGFMGEVEEIQDIELNEALGRDARESVTLRIIDAVAISKLANQNIIAIFLYGKWQNFFIVRRKQNPASPQTEFGLSYKTPKDK